MMNLTQALLKIAATGPDGFEGLIHRLMEALTGYSFFLARSGDQAGRDARSPRTDDAVIAIECKRYGSEREFNTRELLGELTQAATTIGDLDTWVLVTTRSVPEQLFSSLETAARHLHVEFAVISAEGAPGTLEVLCANAPDVCLEFLKDVSTSQELESYAHELQAIGSDPSYSEIHERLKLNLRRSAAYERWRREGNEWLIRHLSTSENSRAVFGQLIDITRQKETGKLVPRTTAAETLSKWYEAWHAEHLPFVVLGEEGDGKTWAVASWLHARILNNTNCPPVLWLSARDVTTQNPVGLIAGVLGQRLGEDFDHWSGHLNRWFRRPHASEPTFIVVLDGINERHTEAWWRGIIEAFLQANWKLHVAVVITARTAYWRYFRQLRYLRNKEVVITPFNDEEFNVALKQARLSIDDIPLQIRALARKPRYFDLVVRHRERLAEAGDVTIARLMYEDWRDRCERKPLELDELKFQELLKDLARQAKNIQAVFAQPELKRIIPTYGETETTLTELATSGVLIPATGGLRVEPNRLQLGFGLLLAERVQEAEADTDPKPLTEIVSEWLESLPDNEMRSRICEFAALHVLLTPDSPVQACSILVHAWLSARNQQTDTSESVMSYFPLNPKSYFTLAELVWTSGRDDPWIQRVLMRTFLRWSADGSHKDVFLDSFERWLGFVHVSGWPTMDTQERTNRRRALNDRLGRTLEPGPFSFLGLTLTAIDDDGLVRLGRVALAVISHLDRSPFVPALVIGCVAEAVMGRPEKYELFSWLVRTAPDSISSDLISAAKNLVAAGEKIAMQIAYRLLTFDGSSASIEVRDALPSDLFPQSALSLEVEADPCVWGGWKKEYYRRCAEREDLNLWHIAKELERFCVEESFEIGPKTRARLIEAGQQFEVSNIHTGPANTEHDVLLRDLEAALCACEPQIAAGIHRRLALEVPKRDKRNLYILLFFLAEQALVFHEEEHEAFLNCWRDLKDADTDDAELSESLLVELMLTAKDGGEQLDILLNRKATASILLAFDPWIKTMSDELLLAALQNANEIGSLRTILYSISMQSRPSSELARLVATFARHPDSIARAFALKTIYRSKDAQSAGLIISEGWSSHPDSCPPERHFGSLLLVENGMSLSFAEIVRRIDLRLLGVAIEARGSRPDEVEQFAERIDSIWDAVLSKAPTLPVDLPPTVIRSTDVPLEEIELVGIAPGLLSSRIQFMSSDSIWGGLENSSGEEVMSAFRGKTDETLDRAQETLREAIEKQKDAANIWFGQRFLPHGLHALTKARHDLVERWLEPALNLNHANHERALTLARSLYESLHEILLNSDPAVGIHLHNVLHETRGSTRVLGGFALLDAIELSLFSAHESEPLIQAWNAQLDAARSDADMLKLSVLAQIGSASRWLENIVRRLVSSARPFDVARALTLCGYTEAPWALDLLQQHASLGRETWHGKLALDALDLQRRDQAAQFRFRQLMREPEVDKAWAGFRLFLRVVDSRVAVWQARYETEALNEKRLSFLHSNAAAIERAIQGNEKEAQEHFLGEKVRERQSWPWMDIEP